MQNKKKNIPDETQIYTRESRVVEQIKKIQALESISFDELRNEYIELGKRYDKLLKQTMRITRTGDSNRKKLFLAKEKIEQQQEELNEAYKKLEILARTDPLTGLSNRRDFIERFQAEKNRFDRKSIPFSLILCDIDDFKTINDRFGHNCGDFVLERIAKTIRSTVRKQDIIGRWGGEEFILLLPETPLKRGVKISERIRKKIAEEAFDFNRLQISITITLGLSEFDGTRDIIPCIKDADDALYAGKKKGKNCVVSAGDIK